MIDLDKKQLQTVTSILSEHLPGITVKAFGSRVTGKAKKFSDLDLVIMDRNPIPPEKLNALKFEFSNSNLPIMIDIIDWQNISDEFRTAIEKDCVDFI